MLVNIKGIGQVDFPDGTTKEQIQAILKKSFSKKKEGNPLSLREIEVMVKGFIKEQVKQPAPIVPDVKVELEPSFEMNADIDVTPIAKAIAKFQSTASEIDMKPIADAIASMKSEPPKVIEIEVTERDTRGFIKTLLCTEIENG